MENLFVGFTNRKTELEKIKRYLNYSTLFYRPDVYFHSLKVHYLVKAVCPYVKFVFGDKFDEKKACIMALVHDDAEMITGDFRSSQTVLMTTQQLEELSNNEEKGIEILSKQFPEFIEGYNYKQLLLEVLHYSSLEAQVVKYIDHIDGYCEAMHEIVAGNECIVTQVETSYGKIPLPPEYYYNRFNSISKYYPFIIDLFKDITPFPSKFENPDYMRLVEFGNSFTKESLSQQTGIDIYDWWKNVLISSLPENYLKNLYTQIEF